MSDANVWQPRVILDISQEVKAVSQKFTATEGQTTFDITDFAYAVGTSSLAVYKEGSLVDAVELSDTSFVIIEGCTAGDKVIARVLVDTVLGDLTDIEQAVLDSAASATSAQLKAWEAEAEKLTADSYATEAASVPVKIYTSNGDGTFTATDTDPTEYSSLHYSTTVDLLNDTTPQLGGILDTNGRLVQFSKGADIASAATLPNAVDGNYANVTGTAAITAITSTGKIGTVIKRHFDAILTLTHHATNLILPNGVDITTAAGDEAEFIEYATGDFICTSYSYASTGATESFAGVAKIATSALAIAGANDTDFITSLKLRQSLNASGTAPIYACRAWVKFNGTGTVAVNGSGNVSGITDNGTGDYTVNITIDIEDINYSVAHTLARVDNTTPAPQVMEAISYTTSSFRVLTHSATATPTDCEIINITILR